MEHAAPRRMPIRRSAARGPGLASLALAAACAAAAPAQDDPVREVLAKLNADDTVQGTEQSKSYRLLFDAYLELSPPPLPISPWFNLTTIHPGMTDWPAVSDWAESNPHVAEAILDCRNTNILGLPYGTEEVDSPYREADLVAAVAVGGSLRRQEFPYLKAMDLIGAWATAEMYRRLEAGETQAALDLAVAHNWVLRQLCDRQFLREKLHSMQLLIDALGNLRDALYAYGDAFSAEQMRELSWYDIPALRPGRHRLHMPEGDRVVSEALLNVVFEGSSRPDPEKFADVFASIQAQDRPLTRFGAARRWRMIAQVHDSLEASRKRLKLIYDDWWRRWRIRGDDTLLEITSVFERTNPVRYAAVIHSMKDIEEVFDMRRRLIASVNGTATAAGLQAYRAFYGVYPDDKEKTYGQFVRKIISDVDPYAGDSGRLEYRYLETDDAIDTFHGRLRLPADQCILYSVGRNGDDDRGRTHTADAAAGDLVFWPPVRQLSREQNLIE